MTEKVTISSSVNKHRYHRGSTDSPICMTATNSSQSPLTDSTTHLNVIPADRLRRAGAWQGGRNACASIGFIGTIRNSVQKKEPTGSRVRGWRLLG